MTLFSPCIFTVGPISPDQDICIAGDGMVQQQSKVCIQTCTLLYIAAFPCIPNCHGIMSHLITGDYVITFERNSFRVQLSARGIATCFASAQPKAQVSGGVDCLCLFLPSKSKSNSNNHSGKFLAPASDCTENSGLLDAQALLHGQQSLLNKLIPCLL